MATSYTASKERCNLTDFCQKHVIISRRNNVCLREVEVDILILIKFLLTITFFTGFWIFFSTVDKNDCYCHYLRLWLDNFIVRLDKSTNDSLRRDGRTGKASQKASFCASQTDISMIWQFMCTLCSLYCSRQYYICDCILAFMRFKN